MAQIITNKLATTASENINLLWENLKTLYDYVNQLPNADRLLELINKITENTKDIADNKKAIETGIAGLDNKKQDKLIAGDNVKIDGNVISMVFSGDVKWDAKNADLSENAQYLDIVDTLTELAQKITDNVEDINSIELGLTSVNQKLEPVLNNISTLLNDMSIAKTDIASNKTEIGNNRTSIIANTSDIADLKTNKADKNIVDKQVIAFDPSNKDFGNFNGGIVIGETSDWKSQVGFNQWGLFYAGDNLVNRGMSEDANIPTSKQIAGYVNDRMNSKQDKLQTTQMTITDDNGTSYTFKVIN